jgi:hydroxypyruvate isomerase
MPNFAANLSTMFTELPFLSRFEAAANAGFDAVEYLFPYEYPAQQLAQLLETHHLKQVLFNTAPGDVSAGEWGLTAVPGREADARRDIDTALEYALALQCPQVHVMAGVVPQGADYQQYEETFINNIRYAAERFAAHNIKVLIEALNPKTKPNYLFSSQYQTMALVKKIDRPNVFTQLDLFHAQLVDGNLSHLISDFTHCYAHIQIASAPARHEPDEGEINYPYLFNLLDEVGYTGWIGCEYLPRGKTEEGLSWLKPYRK